MKYYTTCAAPSRDSTMLAVDPCSEDGSSFAGPSFLAFLDVGTVPMPSSVVRGLQSWLFPLSRYLSNFLNAFACAWLQRCKNGLALLGLLTNRLASSLHSPLLLQVKLGVGQSLSHTSSDCRRKASWMGDYPAQVKPVLYENTLDSLAELWQLLNLEFQHVGSSSWSLLNIDRLWIWSFDISGPAPDLSRMEFGGIQTMRIAWTASLVIARKV